MRARNSGCRIVSSALVVMLMSACGGGSGDATTAPIPPLTGPGASWTSVTAPAGGTAWRGVAYGNGVWAAVGNGVRGSSTNGTTWTSVTIPPSNSYYSNADLIFANGLFMATTGLGVVTSTNGTSWTGQSFSAAQFLTGIAYGNGSWVIVDDRFLSTDVLVFFMSSTGAGGWQQIVTSIPYAQPTAMAFGNGAFVVVGYGGLVARSTNGSTWTQGSFNTTSDLGVIAVIFANGMFVATTNTGVAYRSTDGTTWTKAKATPGSINALTFGNGVFVGVCDGGNVYTSADAITWTLRSASSGVTNNLDAIGFGNSKFVAVGSGSFAVSQ